MKRITSSGRRRNPGRTSLSERNVKPDPIDQFENWFRPVLRSKNPQPCAMALATASKKGLPTVRIVLLKNYDRNGFTFYTNYESVKGKQLADNPRAALLFYWPQFERQVRIEGSCR
ncbi:MAG TPA: pyridoxamine 5'-phosphate oxidase family protein, partial [Terriglobia bacterium]|nr:pyridoxamine 5'-phosphate oxidase family protein [Terriglobia bacterium]